MKKGVIYQYHQEIETWKSHGSILIKFHRESIALFYQENQKDLDSIFEELKDLQRSFLEFTGDELKKDEKDNAIFLQGKTQAQFEEAWMAIMEKEIPPFKVTHKKPLAEA